VIGERENLKNVRNNKEILEWVPNFNFGTVPLKNVGKTTKIIRNIVHWI